MLSVHQSLPSNNDNTGGNDAAHCNQHHRPHLPLCCPAIKASSHHLLSPLSFSLPEFTRPCYDSLLVTRLICFCPSKSSRYSDSDSARCQHPACSPSGRFPLLVTSATITVACLHAHFWFSSEIIFLFFCIVVDIMIKMWLPWAWKCTGSTEANTEALPVWVWLTIFKLPCNDEKMFQLSFHWLALSFAMPVSSIASFDLSKSSAESWRLLQLCDVKIAKCNMSV